MDPASFVHLKVSVEDEGRCLQVELDHGKANEMGEAQLAEFERLTEAVIESPTVVALITWSRRRSSRGTPIFVAGANVTERVGWDDERIREHVRRQRRVLTELRHAPVFHVVVVDGLALGWGTEYLLTADWRIAGEQAEFGLPETGIGILPGAGGTSELWAEVGVGHALRLGMTGERIGAAEALRIGLVHERCADVDAGLTRARALAAMVAKRSPTALAAFKEGVLHSVGRPEDERRETEARAYEQCVASGDAGIGRGAFDAIRAGGVPAWGPRRRWKR